MDTIVPSDIPLGKHYVYTLAYPDGKVFYVGKGQGNRIHLHEIEARGKTTHNPYKCNVIRKIWREGGQIVKTIIDYFNTHEEASMLEIALIFFLPDLTNLTRGGDGIVGLPRTAEHQSKIANARRGKKASLETRRRNSEAAKRDPTLTYRIHKMAEANKGRPSWKKGIPNSAETRSKLSKALRGKTRKPLSAETRQKISESNKRRNHPSPSPETRQKLREAMKGREITPEWRTKISQSLTGRQHPHSAEWRSKVSKANKGKKHTEEARRKMSEIQKAKYPPLPTKICEICKKEWHPTNRTQAKNNRTCSKECSIKLRNRKGVSRQPHSEEWKRKMSETMTGRTYSEVTLQKMREAAQKKPPPSEEQRHKISETLKRRAAEKRATNAHTSIPITWPLDQTFLLKCEDINQLSLWNDA